MKKPKHTIAHHLFMVIFTEGINMAWLFIGAILLLLGYFAFKTATLAFWRLALGLPLLLMGLSISLFKVHEVIKVIVKPKELAAVCYFCKSGNP